MGPILPACLPAWHDVSPAMNMTELCLAGLYTHYYYYHYYSCPKPSVSSTAVESLLLRVS